MALAFFADHCVGTEVIRRLRDAGYETLPLREHLPCDSPDAEVIEAAQKFGTILISHDGDFADIVTYPPSQYQGIIALLVKNHPEVIPQVMDRLLQYLALQPEKTHYEGKLLLVEPHRIRIRT